MTEAFPPVGEAPWELRFTRRALTDIGAASAKDHPGDLQAVRRVSTYPRVVDDFLQKRPVAADVPGWPGTNLLATLAALVGDGDLDYPAGLPTEGGWRPLDPATELGIVLRNVMLPTQP